jgi:transporter family-2 protein
VKPLLYLFVAAAGALTSVESGANAKLTDSLGGPWWPALIFSLISIGCLAIGALVWAGPFPAAQMAQVPWWAWAGGVISALYVMSMLIAPGQLGAGLFTGLTVIAAIIASIALDHFGLVGFPQHAAGLGRLIGAALMIAGIVCVAVF